MSFVQICLKRLRTRHGVRLHCHTEMMQPNRYAVPLKTLAKKIGRQLRYAPCDVTDEESVSRAFECAEKGARYPVQGLVTCAGISGRSAATEYPVDEFRRIMDINVTGTFLCATAAARIMQRCVVPGSIVMLASMSGTNVNKVCVVYGKLPYEQGTNGQ